MFRSGIFLALTLFLSINGVPLNTKKCPDGYTYFEGTNFCYGYYGAAGLSFWSGEQACNNQGGHIPSIHSDAEAKFLQNLSKDFGHEFYIGLYREGLKRQWIDKTPVDYSVYLNLDTTCWFQSECCYVMIPKGVYSRHCNDRSTPIQCKIPALK